MTSVKKIVSMFLIIFSSITYAFAPIPPIARVVDLTQTLKTEQINYLTTVLKQFEAKKGAQIAILIVNTTKPETIEEYSLRVEENWKLGRKNIDDGVLLTIALSDRKMRIETGYGLEGVLNDTVSNQILNETIIPYFKKGQMFEGIDKGISQIINLIQGEPLPQNVISKTPHHDSIQYGLFLIILLFISSFLIKNFRTIIAMLPGIIIASVVWLLTKSWPFTLLSCLVVYYIMGFRKAISYGSWSYESSGSSNSGGDSNNSSSSDSFSGGGGSSGGGGASGEW